MRIIMNRLIMSVFLVSVIACSKDNEYVIGGKNDTDPFKPIDAMTKYLNSKNGGVVTSDTAYDYFQYFDTECVSLCKKERSTGKVSKLAELPWKEGSNADVMFTNLHLKGEYLYFMVFDGNNKIPLTWSRVPIDGSSTYEKIREMGIKFLGMVFKDEDIYVVYASDTPSNTISLMDMETGNLTPCWEISDDFSVEFIHGEYAYCKKYATTDGIFHSMLYRVPLNGSEPEMIWNYPENQSVDCFVVEEKLYVIDYYGKRLYETDLDGKNKKLLLKDIDIRRMNTDCGTIYFLLGQTSSYDAGLYSYTPETGMLFLLCKGDDFNMGPIVTGTSVIWCTKNNEAFRLGQPVYIDSCHDRYDAMQ